MKGCYVRPLVLLESHRTVWYFYQAGFTFCHKTCSVSLKLRWSLIQQDKTAVLWVPKKAKQQLKQKRALNLGITLSSNCSFLYKDFWSLKCWGNGDDSRDACNSVTVTSKYIIKSHVPYIAVSVLILLGGICFRQHCNVLFVNGFVFRVHERGRIIWRFAVVLGFFRITSW